LLLLLAGAACGGCGHDGGTVGTQSDSIRTLNRHNEELAIAAFLKDKAASSAGADASAPCAKYAEVLDVEVREERRLGDAVLVTATITASAEPQAATATAARVGCVGAPGGTDRNQSTTVTGEQFRFRHGPDGWRIAGR
jgi:hypothetical protein